MALSKVQKNIISIFNESLKGGESLEERYGLKYLHANYEYNMKKNDHSKTISYRYHYAIKRAEELSIVNKRSMLETIRHEMGVSKSTLWGYLNNVKE